MVFALKEWDNSLSPVRLVMISAYAASISNGKLVMTC